MIRPLFIIMFNKKHKNVGPMPTSAHYISVNNCKNQPPKAVQPATKQSTGLFLPNLQTNLEQLVVGSSPLIE